MHVRYEVRKAVRVPVEVVCAEWDEPVAMTTADLSPRGCFLPTGVLVEPGTSLVVSFRIGGEAGECSFFGEVSRVARWRRRTDPRFGGLGVRFIGLRPIERLRLRERLRRVPPPLPSRRRGRVPPPLPVLRAAAA